MEVKERIKNFIKEDKLEKLDKYNSSTLSNMFLEILQDELSSFSYDKDLNLDYLKTIIKLLPNHMPKCNISHIDDRLKVIHQQIKTFLVQKPGDIEKTNHNYRLFKELINDIELIQMSILYDYIDKYQGSKYQLINYIIFELKNISIFNDALNKFPFLVNYFDQDDTNLIVSVTNAYIDSIVSYNEINGIDDINYYDQVITSIINSKEFRFDIIDKQTILKRIREELINLDGDKERKSFYLNSLREKINGEEIEQTDSYNEYKFNISTIFNEAIKSEVRRVIDTYSMSKDRKIIDDYILSFDGEGTEEIDDSLSVKIIDDDSILLGVHIADPLDLIGQDSIIFEEAVKRTTSIYLSDKSYPMFPREIGSDLASLKEKKYRPATSYYFKIDKNGNLVNYDFKKTIIKVNRNLTYDDFNYILNMNGSDQLKQTVDNLSLVSGILQNYYSVDPLYQKVNRNKSNITNTNIIGTTSGEKAVESAMIFTNHIVAKHFKDNKLPFIFRNHTFDNKTIIELDSLKNKLLFENDSNAYIRYIDIIKCLYPKAVYGVECKGHEGLGLNEYSHVTSPLRRLADVIALICLEKLYFNYYDNETKNEVKKLVIKYSDIINKKRNGIERFSEVYEKLRRCA